MAKVETCSNVAVQLLLCVALAKGWLFNNDNCYRNPNVGCFPVTRPWTNAMGFAPQSPRRMNVHLVLRRPEGSQRFSLRHAKRVLRPRFDPSLKTVVLIHGYLETYESDWINSMVTELERQPPMNIFVVDWGNGASSFNFLQSVANTRMAGAITALFLQKMIDLGASNSSFHLIGFSLGAHVAGYAGDRVSGLGRITGLDPAGPGFLGTPPSVRLDPTDAVVVDAIHTDNDLGSLSRRGTIDFYPNGGATQPECDSSAMNRISNLMARLDFSRRAVTRTIGCSHIRAPHLFISSINHQCSFAMKECRTVRDMSANRGVSCGSGQCPRFGYHLDFSQTPRPGIYRFSTSGSNPFC